MSGFVQTNVNEEIELGNFTQCFVYSVHCAHLSYGTPRNDAGIFAMAFEQIFFTQNVFGMRKHGMYPDSRTPKFNNQQNIEIERRK